MDNIETMKKNRTLSKQAQHKIRTAIIANWAIGIAMVFLIMILKISANLLPKTLSIKIYNISAMVLLIFTLILMEFAYKKDNDRTCNK